MDNEHELAISPETYWVHKPGHESHAPLLATVVKTGPNGKVKVHYLKSDKRLDEWIYSSFLVPSSSGSRSSTSTSLPGDDASPHVSDSAALSTEPNDLYDIEKVVFGGYLIKTWYSSPYPIEFVNPEPLANPDGPHLVVKLVLWVCHRCFKYMSRTAYEHHKTECLVDQPPGPTVYRHGALRIYEVDGALDKTYCQNLTLFSKLFIDTKTLYFDCEGFVFYLLTRETAEGEEMIGYFSKEKISFDGNNLACILTLPPYQKQGFGMLMIEFSYELSRRAGKIGGPEQPLSDLGLMSYMSYWVATLIRYMQSRIVILPQGADSDEETTFTSYNRPIDFSVILMNRRATLSYGEDIDSLENSDDSLSDEEDSRPTAAVRGKTRFVQGLLPNGTWAIDAQFRATIQDLSEATSLTPRDVRFALRESGLMDDKVEMDEDPNKILFVLTKERLDREAELRKLKPSRFDRKYVLL